MIRNTIIKLSRLRILWSKELEEVNLDRCGSLAEGEAKADMAANAKTN